MSTRRSAAANGGVQREDSKRANETPIERQARLLASDSGHFSLVRAFHLADLITLMNGFCGFMSVLSSLRYVSGDPRELGNIYAALGFIPFGLFFDFMDGKVARWRKKASMMGQELDSLADLVSFGVSPAACAFSIGVRTPADHFLLTFFVLAGLARLARFNVTAQYLPKDATGKSNYFEGFPIPTSLALVGVMTYWVSQGWTGPNLPAGVALQGTPLEFHPIALLFVVHGCLMVSKTLHIPKP